MTKQVQQSIVGTWKVIKENYRFELGLALIMILYALAGYGLALLYDVGLRFSFFVYGSLHLKITFFAFMLFIAWHTYTTMIFVRPRRLTLYLYRDLRYSYFTNERLVRGLPLYFLTMIFVGAFTSIKTLIPVINPFSWDPFFMKLDSLLHGGVAPWRLLQPVLGFPIVTYIINFVYNCWLIVIFCVFYWQLFQLSKPKLRIRFIYSFVLCWIVPGSMMAVPLAAAGPCFYSDIVPGGQAFQEQMAYLQRVDKIYPVWALDMQNTLLSYYKKEEVTYGAGITAMPSMHVSIAFLIVLLARYYHRCVRYAAYIFFAFIMIGSVHLAWHYAIDGYVSIIATAAIWWATGRFLVPGTGSSHSIRG